MAQKIILKPLVITKEYFFISTSNIKIDLN